MSMLFKDRLMSQRNKTSEKIKHTILMAKSHAITISIFNNSNESKNNPMIIIATRKILVVARRMAR